MELPARISLNSLIFSLNIYIVDFLGHGEVVTLVNRWPQPCGLPVGGVKCDKIAVEDRYLAHFEVAVFNRSIVYRVYPALPSLALS